MTIAIATVTEQFVCSYQPSTLSPIQNNSKCTRDPIYELESRALRFECERLRNGIHLKGMAGVKSLQRRCNQMQKEFEKPFQIAMQMF